jgi:hypothetical protein
LPAYDRANRSDTYVTNTVFMIDEHDLWFEILIQIKKRYYLAPYHRDIEAEIMEALAMEITAEIDKDILKKINEIAHKWSMI